MKVYKAEIVPTETQIEQIRRTQGVCRFVYNLFIVVNRDRYQKGLQYLSGYDFAKYLNHEYREEHPEQEWIQEVSSKSIKRSIMDADRAFKKFLNKETEFPDFRRKRGVPVDVYCPRNGVDSKNVEVQRNRLRVPIIGWIRFKRYGRIPEGYPSSITIKSTKEGKYYASALYDTNDLTLKPKQKASSHKI